MTHRVILGILYLISAVLAIVMGVRQRRERKGFRVLFFAGAVALLCAAERIWIN